MSGDGPALESVASVVHRLAVLLAAGVAPAGAWEHACADIDGTDAERMISVAAAARDGAPVGEAIVTTCTTNGADDAAWRAVAAAWAVATDSGAALAPALRRFAHSLRELAQTHRDVETALAGPRATTRVVLALPLIGVLFGVALGFDTLGVLFGSAAGFACLVAGTALLVAARHWNGRLVRGATPTDISPGLRLELVAIAMSGGAAIPRALAAVDTVLVRCGLDPGGTDAVDTLVGLSRRAGVPAAELLRAEAEEHRRSARAHAQQSAARLAVTLMLPLGVCVLPSFMLLGVAPLMISVISATVSGF